MSQQRINAQEIAADVSSGMADEDIMQKYGLSEEKFVDVLHLLLEKDILKIEDIHSRLETPSVVPEHFILADDLDETPTIRIDFAPRNDEDDSTLRIDILNWENLDEEDGMDSIEINFDFRDSVLKK